ncbi:recombinase family protein [Streptomyces sp. CoH27]|uniref:recombinase family protein n=1 Tax=Streptomyces sp. CoH27 TaxID=2875763 RepID=UPI001CD7BB23|nr:recombinase family protein [Streptomyces sp. CoH27]
MVRAADPVRNPHREGQRWVLNTVRAILANPRYTGRQVWNRQRTDHDLVDPANTTLGHHDVMRWNTPTDWIISARPAHPALVSEVDFITVQNLRTRRETTSGHTYLLTGLLCCGICGRRMESHWTHHRPGYRCRHGHTSATRPDPGRALNAYLREDHVLPHLAALHLRLTSRLGRPGSASVSRDAVQPTPAQAIAHLRSEEITLAYDPAARTLTADTPQAERITIS